MTSPLFIPPFTPRSSPLATHTPYTPRGVNTPDGAHPLGEALKKVPMPPVSGGG